MEKINPIGKENTRISFKKTDSKTKDFAFIKANKLNSMEKPYKQGDKWFINKWRVGKNTEEQLIIEKDNHNETSLKELLDKLHILFQYEFKVVKTLHGFHIIGLKVYTNKLDWLYANALLLKQDLKKDELNNFIKILVQFDDEIRSKENNNVKDLFITTSIQSKIFNLIHYDFDLLYTALSIKYGKSTLRISKKTKDDKYEQFDINN